MAKMWAGRFAKELDKTADDFNSSIRFDCKLYKEIIIENDGENISNEDIKNIFKRFYKGQNSSKNSVGIGLALADAIVRHDGGYIVAENTNPPATPGVKFTIRYIL